MSLEQAVNLRDNGHLKESKDLLLSMLESIPNDPVVNYHCASVHDSLGLEKEAVTYYKMALKKGLDGQNRRNALLGLGSTYRALGQYQLSKETFEEGMKHYPEANEFAIFQAMTLYNLKEYEKSVEMLINKIIEVTDDQGIKKYNRALTFYAKHLNEIVK